MLKWALLEENLRLRQQIRAAQRSKPRSRLLHLPPARSNDQDKSVRETAYLMQLRLHLEAQILPETSGD